MKKALFIMLILITAGSFAFANGRPETPAWTEGHPCYVNEQEEIIVTGKLVMDENEWTRLVADGKEYLLMYPYGIDLGIDLTSGDEITVEGFAREFKTPDEYIHLIVNRATIDGKVYILAGPGMHYNGGPDPHMRGPFGEDFHNNNSMMGPGYGHCR